MEDVTVDKSKLLEILKKNRKEHHEAFVEAQKGYKQNTRRCESRQEDRKLYWIIGTR